MKILFVCTGNICRSPSAEGVLRHALRVAGMEAEFMVDSAGTQGYHAGEAPDPRSQTIALARGYDLSSLRARQVNLADFQEFNLILALDRSHLAALERLLPRQASAEVALFLPYAGITHTRDVPDPYYGGPEDFARTLALIEEGVAGLMKKLVPPHG